MSESIMVDGRIHECLQQSARSGNPRLYRSHCDATDLRDFLMAHAIGGDKYKGLPRKIRQLPKETLQILEILSPCHVLHDCILHKFIFENFFLAPSSSLLLEEQVAQNCKYPCFQRCPGNKLGPGGQSTHHGILNQIICTDPIAGQVPRKRPQFGQNSNNAAMECV